MDLNELSKQYYSIDINIRHGRLSSLYQKGRKYYDFLIILRKLPEMIYRGYGDTIEAAFQDAMMDRDKQEIKASWNAASRRNNV